MGLNQTEFAALADQSKKSQMRYESGERSPDGTYFAALAAAGADITYILTGVRTISALPAGVLEIARQAGEQAGIVEDQDRLAEWMKLAIVTIPSEFAQIPLHASFLAAGNGAANDDEAVIDHLAFRRDWLQRISVAEDAARLARICGESMHPTISAGDLILIDTKAPLPEVKPRDPKDQRQAPVYALIDHGEARVKRVERPAEDMMLLVSDNPSYPPELRQGEDVASIQVIGKVVWWGHTARE